MRLLTLLCAALLFSSPSLASKPNLLLLLPDQWRSDWDSIPRPTEGAGTVERESASCSEAEGEVEKEKRGQRSQVLFG